jgi:8-oxo-dGTP diphosphatase
LKQAQKRPRRWQRCLRFRSRRRGTAVVDTCRGILVVSEDGKKYDLPGGAAKEGESRREAALRELEEETGLKADKCAWLFEYNGRIQRSVKGGFFKDNHKVYLMKVTGAAEPKNEIKHIAYTKDSKVTLSYAANQIIKKYSEAEIKC